MFFNSLFCNPFKYNLFTSFKKRLKAIKHIEKQDGQIIRYYHKLLLHTGLRYLRFWLILTCIAIASVFIHKGTSKFLDNRNITSYKITQDANVRTKPSLNSDVYKIFNGGKKIDGTDVGEWIEIVEDGQSYYISKSLVKPSASGFILLIKILKFLSDLIYVCIPSIIRVLKHLYAESSIVQVLCIIIGFVILLKLYNKLGRDKYSSIEIALEQICQNCGYFGYIKKTKEFYDTETTQESRITYRTGTSTRRNARGDVLSTETSSIPVSTIVNVHTDAYKINYYCKKCNNNSYKFTFETWES